MMDHIFFVTTSLSQTTNEVSHSPPFHNKESKILQPFIIGDICYIPAFACCSPQASHQFAFLSLSMANQGWTPCSSSLHSPTDLLPARNMGSPWVSNVIFCSIIALLYVLTKLP